MELYSYWRSSAAYRVRIALNLKGIEAAQHTLDLRTQAHRGADYLAKNPQGLVPALRVDGTVLSQSLAIIEYLEDVRPQPALLPREPIARAQVRALAMVIACDIHPIDNLRVLQYLKQRMDQPQPAIDEWYRHWITEGFRALEQQVQVHGGQGRYMFGSAVTMADVCLAPQLYNAARLQLDMTPFPTLAAIGAHLSTLPAFAAAAPERQADAG